MSWARLDDGFHAHPKIRKLSLAARGLFCTALSYAAHYETDGLLDEEFVKSLQRGKGGRGAVKELTVSGMFEPAEGAALAIHDYAQWNPTRDELDAIRRRDSRKKALYRDRPLLAAIRQRDEDHCRYCGEAVDWKDRRGPLGATYDHVDPTGDNSAGNIAVACRRCNSLKGARTPGAANMPLLPARGAQMGLGGSGADLVPDPHTRGGSGGSTDTSTENGSELHARVDEVLAVLNRSPRFTVDDVNTRIGVENAIAAQPDKDPVTAAHEAVTWASDPAWRKTNPASCLLDAMRKQPDPKEAPMAGEAERRYGKLGQRGPKVCPHGECDGQHFVIDEETDEAKRCRCHPQYGVAA